MINHKPFIGITTAARNEKGEFFLAGQYVDSVRRAGGIPILLPPGEKEIMALIHCLDGVLLSGGGDIDPDRYNGKQHEQIYKVDHERDQTELDIANEILKQKIPMLAVCRGIQIINILLGGTLHAHIPDEYGEKVIHRLPPVVPTKHSVSVDTDSRLYSILQTSELEIISWHHQAINQLADGLKVVARSPDNVIEAIEMESNKWLVGVQWHPELTSHEDPLQQALFDSLVMNARLFANKKLSN